jgi:hypothetical protein
VVVHICNPSTQEAEAGGLNIQSPPGLRSKTLSLKKKNKNTKPRTGDVNVQGPGFDLQHHSKNKYSWAPWLMPVIPATQEAEVRKIEVQSQPR